LKKKSTIKVKLDPTKTRNPYAVAARFMKAGAFKDRKKEASKRACRGKGWE